MNDQFKELIQKYADQYGIPRKIVYGVCMTESGMNQFAARFEPKWHYFVDPAKARPKGCSIDTETDLQKISYGLMQVMGSVYRQFGFTGWLTEIVARPEVQLDIGCKYLAQLIKKWGLEGGIASYNNGIPDRNHDGQIDNPEYVKSVLDNSKQYVE